MPLLSVAGFAVGSVLMALIGPRLDPRDGFVLWPMVLMVTALAVVLILGRSYILPVWLATNLLPAGLAIIALVSVTQLLAFGAALAFYLVFQVPLPWMLVIWFTLLWTGVNVLHRADLGRG